MSTPVIFEGKYPQDVMLWYGVYGLESFVLARLHDTNEITLYQGILRINLHRITIDNSVSRTIKYVVVVVFVVM